MELKNGYKVIYDKAANGEHVFYASKTGIFADADKIGSFEAGKYKLIYEKNGQFFGSESGVPTDNDYRFAEFDKVFVEAEANNEPVAANEEATTPDDVAKETPVEVEEPSEGEDEPATEPEE